VSPVVENVESFWMLMQQEVMEVIEVAAVTALGIDVHSSSHNTDTQFFFQ